jgi:cardiolipin synthase
MLGVLAYHFFIDSLEMEPALLSKLNTLCQILLIVAIIINQLSGFTISQAVDWLVYLVALTTILSGMQYSWHWGRKAWQMVRARKARSEPCRQQTETTNHG